MHRALRRVYIAGGLFFLAALCTALLGAEHLPVHGATIVVTNVNDSGKIVSNGANAYPPKKQFAEFRAAVQELTGGRRFE